jgi:hypothetical protein
MAERWIGMVDHPTLTFADSQANDHFRISMVHFPSFLFPSQNRMEKEFLRRGEERISRTREDLKMRRKKRPGTG